MNAKAKGSRRERQARKALEARGYQCTRAAGSLGMWDICAVNATSPIVGCSTLLLQVKSNRWPGCAEMRAMCEAKRAYHQTVRCEVWRYDDGRKEPRVKVL